jgi:hypothetical protein
MIGNTEGFGSRWEEAAAFFHIHKLMWGKETELVGNAMPEFVIGLKPWVSGLMLLPVPIAHEGAWC